VQAVIKKYSITQINRVLEELRAWHESTEETLDNEENKDYPNEERVDMLQTRLDSLQEAIDALENIE